MWKKRQLTHPKSIDPFSSFSSPVYTCDFAYELTYDSVYDFLHKVVCN
jgi:hypothetical protein